jgi:hypothetical protein
MVIEFLNEDYEGRWIGRGGPMAWPPQSPDLNSLHFLELHKVKRVSWWETRSKASVEAIDSSRHWYQKQIGMHAVAQ